MNKMAKTINDIMEAVYALNTPNLGWNYERNTQDEELIRIVINGDEIREYLPIIANITPKNPGILLYILTNARLIKIEISKKEKITSISYFLNIMISIDRKNLENNRMSINIIFHNTSVGLTYNMENRNITEFFQKIEEFKAGKSSLNA